MKITMIQTWAIEVYGEADRRMWGSIKLDTAPSTFRDKKIQYNQLDTWATDCTLYASMGAISDLTGKVFTLEERKEIHQLALDWWLDPAVWRWIHLAVDLLRTYTGWLSSVSMLIKSPQFWNSIEKGYSIVSWYKGSRAVTADMNDNCIMDEAEHGVSTYWHCIRISKKGDYIYIINNYDTILPCNIVRFDTFKEMVDNWVFFRNWYIFTSEIKPMDPLTNLPPHIKPEQVDNNWIRNWIKARENEMIDAIEKWYEPYQNYLDWWIDAVYPKMLIDLAFIRKGIITKHQ